MKLLVQISLINEMDKSLNKNMSMEIIGDYNSDEKKKKNWKPMGPFVVLAV